MTVTSDATSGKFIPQSAAEWTTLLAGSGISNPSALWLCQEASGNLADSIGAFTLTAGGTAAAYAQAVTGWSTKGVTLSKGNPSNFISNSGSLPAINATSCMIFCWIKQPIVNAGLTEVSIISFADPRNGTGMAAETNGGGATNALKCISGANTASGSLGLGGFFDGTVHPLIVQNDHTNSASNVQSDLETVTATFGSFSSTKRLTLGGDNTGTTTWRSSGATHLYMAMWTGSAAELDATHRTTLLSRMNTGPVASGGGRLAGASPLVQSGLVNSPLVNGAPSRLMKSRRDRYAQLQGGI